MADTTLQVVAVENERWRRLAHELEDALSRTNGRDLTDWATNAGKVTLAAGGRRVRNLWRLGSDGVEWINDGARHAIEAGREGRFQEHVTARAQANWEDGAAFAKRAVEKAKTFAELARDRERLPEIAVMVVAALVSSGGIDADGGVPDLDLAFGIDAHRSLLSHSIIAGTVVEGSVYALATLVGLIHAKLPVAHDEWWDIIERNRARYLQQVSAGASFGISYHLLVDGLVQPGAYHDLPVSAPMEVHESILVVNGVAEGIDARHKGQTFRPK